MGKPLTAELILQRTKADRLENVKNLNLWGNEIDDVRIIREMPNIEILSLSVNKIKSLKDFSYCANLTEIYLRKNMIADLSEIKYLQNLPKLKVLWLWDNPCAEQPNYREIVISSLPNLVKLDNQPITPEERGNAHPVESESAPRKERPNTGAERRAQPRRNREESSRNENILCAVLALLKELDESGLELVKRDIDRKLNNR